jgi:hypothetical protein
MSDVTVLEIALQAIIIAAKLAAPILLVTLAVGFGISLLQSVTQIQEVTLTFVPKLGCGRPRAAVRRQLDAGRDGVVHRGSLRDDPGAGRQDMTRT